MPWSKRTQHGDKKTETDEKKDIVLYSNHFVHAPSLVRAIANLWPDAPHHAMDMLNAFEDLPVWAAVQILADEGVDTYEGPGTSSVIISYRRNRPACPAAAKSHT